jgi:hypothetical protein
VLSPLKAGGLLKALVAPSTDGASGSGSGGSGGGSGSPRAAGEGFEDDNCPYDDDDDDDDDDDENVDTENGDDVDNEDEDTEEEDGVPVSLLLQQQQQQERQQQQQPSYAGVSINPSDLGEDAWKDDDQLIAAAAAAAAAAAMQRKQQSEQNSYQTMVNSLISNARSSLASSTGQGMTAIPSTSNGSGEEGQEDLDGDEVDGNTSAVAAQSVDEPSSKSISSSGFTMGGLLNIDTASIRQSVVGATTTANGDSIDDPSEDRQQKRPPHLSVGSPTAASSSGKGGSDTGGAAPSPAQAPPPPPSAAAAAAAAAAGAGMSGDGNESLLTFMRQMRAHLGRMQLHLHRYNKYFLRFHALQTWRDAASTIFLLGVLFFGAVWLVVVPNNITFALASIYCFTRPLRRGEFYRRPTEEEAGGGLEDGSGAVAPAKGRQQSIVMTENRVRDRSLFDTILYQWLDGIPLDAPTHRDLTTAVQRALDDATW